MNSILILDDEPAVRQSFVDYFEDRLWQTLQAASAEEALKLLESQRPDAAIVDVRLPGIDGHQFIRELMGRDLQIICLICTGSPEYEIPDDLQNVPWVSATVFVKPLTDMAVLEQEVARLLAVATSV